MEKNKKIAYLLSVVFFVALGMSYFYADVGFAIKPYMIAVLLIALYVGFQYRHSFKSLTIRNVGFHEVCYLLFLAMIAGSFIWSYDIDASLRFTANVMILLFSYMILRVFFTDLLSLGRIKKSIILAGGIVVVASLVFYISGLLQLGMDFSEKGIIVSGVMVDRGYPRLVGTMSLDPNFAALVLSVFFAFILLHKKILVWKLALVIAIILTFSRGAYVAILAAILSYAALARTGLRNILRFIAAGIVGVAAITLIFGFIGDATDFRVGDIISSRVDDTSADGGSGRVDLWGNAFSTFLSSPLLGVGANASRSFNIDNYNDSHYNHNTYLDVLAELGIVGVFLFTVLIISLVNLSLRSLRAGEASPLLLVLFVFFTIFFLTAMTSEVVMVTVLLATVYGIGLRGSRKGEKRLL